MPDPSSSDAERFPRLCEGWALTPEQVETFFALSSEMDSRAYHHEYDTAPCMIEGGLVDDGRQWAFHINGAAKDYWSDGSDTRYFGCTAAACDALVLVPHIGMDP